MPFNYNPFFMSNLLVNAGKLAYNQLDSKPSQGLTNAVGQTSLLASDIYGGFTRGIQNGIRNESKPSQGLTNFVGNAYNGFVDAGKGIEQNLSTIGSGMQRATYDLVHTPRDYMPLNSGFIPAGDGSYIPATGNEIRGFNYATSFPFNQQPLSPEQGYQSAQPSRVGVLNSQPQAQMSQSLQPIQRVSQPKANKPISMSNADADELSRIRLHSAIPSQNMFSISDSSGNRGWAGVGDSVNGWKVKSYDKGFVVVEKNGVTAKIGLQGSSPTEYTPPVEMEKSKALGSGTLSDREQELMGDFNISGSDRLQFNIARDAFENIKRNAQKSPYMSDEDKKSILHMDEYMKKAQNQELEAGKRYFIPRMDNSGNVDFDVFTPLER